METRSEPEEETTRWNSSVPAYRGLFQRMLSGATEPAVETEAELPPLNATVAAEAVNSPPGSAAYDGSVPGTHAYGDAETGLVYSNIEDGGADDDQSEEDSDQELEVVGTKPPSPAGFKTTGLLEESSDEDEDVEDGEDKDGDEDYCAVDEEPDDGDPVVREHERRLEEAKHKEYTDLRTEDLTKKIKIFVDARFGVELATDKGGPGWRCNHCGFFARSPNVSKALAHLNRYRDSSISVKGCTNVQDMEPEQRRMYANLMTIRNETRNNNVARRDAIKTVVSDNHQRLVGVAMEAPGRNQKAIAKKKQINAMVFSSKTKDTSKVAAYSKKPPKSGNIASKTTSSNVGSNTLANAWSKGFASGSISTPTSTDVIEVSTHVCLYIKES